MARPHWCCFLTYTAGASLVRQQSIWRIDRHWETVSQSLVHCEDILAVWEVLCRATWYDQREGTSLTADMHPLIIKNVQFFMHSCHQIIVLFWFRNSMMSGQLNWETWNHIRGQRRLMAGYVSFCYYFILCKTVRCWLHAVSIKEMYFCMLHRKSTSTKLLIIF